MKKNSTPSEHDARTSEVRSRGFKIRRLGDRKFKLKAYVGRTATGK